MLDTGADSLSAAAACLGLLGFDFRVDSVPELADEVRARAARYLRAVPRGKPPPRDSPTGTGTACA